MAGYAGAARGSYLEAFVRRHGSSGPAMFAGAGGSGSAPGPGGQPAPPPPSLLLPPGLDRDRLIADRGAYIAYLETQLERACAACLLMESAVERVAEQGEEIARLRESLSKCEEDN